jgi:uncharacterized protein (DUF1778 family)
LGITICPLLDNLTVAAIIAYTSSKTISIVRIFILGWLMVDSKLAFTLEPLARLCAKVTQKLLLEGFKTIMPMCQFDTLGDKIMAAILPRITARVDVDTQDLLTKAAALTGMSSINSFVLNAAIEKAKQVIEREQTLKLSQADAILLMKALDNPAVANAKLKAASERYECKDQS